MKKAAILSLSLLAIGCVAVPRSVVPPVQPQLAAATQAAPVEMTAGMGSVTIRVRWPGYQTQLLPLSTQTLDVTVRDASSALVGSATLTRNSGESTATATIERIPSGQVTVRAEAKNSGGTVVASGQQVLTLEANKKTPLSLTLNPTNPPSITSFSPVAGGPGTSVTLSGDNFPTGDVTYSLSVGGVSVSATQMQAFGSSSFQFYVPEGATTSAITFTVDGVTTTSTGSFTTVASLSLSPATGPALATGSTRVYTATAFDASNATVSAAAVTWSLSNLTGLNQSTDPAAGIASLGSFSPSTGTTDGSGQASSTFAASATGSGWVNVYSGSSRATASVTVE